MEIFRAIIQLLGGLAMFLYGIEVMGDGLKNSSGDALKRVLEKVTGNVVIGVLTGALVTAVDTNGDFRFIYVNHNAVEGEGRVTLEDGSESETCFRYAPDGTLTRSCDNGGWTPVD